MSNKDNDDDGLLGWCAMRPIVLPAGDTFLQKLIDDGHARKVTSRSQEIDPKQLAVQPRYEYVFFDAPLAKIDMGNIAEAIAAVEARNATKH